MSSLCSEATGVPSRTILEPIHSGMWRFFGKRWRASVSVHLSAEIQNFSLFPLLTSITLCWFFKQELMKMPSLNSWVAAPTSRGYHWSQPIKLPMARSDWLCFISWSRHEAAPPPPHAVSFFPMFVRIWSVTWNPSLMETLRIWRWPCWRLLLSLTQLNSEKP